MVDYQSVIPTLDTSHVKTTSVFSATYYGYKACDTSVSLTGGWAGWISVFDASGYTNQKFNIDLGSGHVITRIKYANAHDSGTTTEVGAKNFIFYGTNSSTAFDNTTYSNTTDLTELYSGTFDQHTGSDVADLKYIVVSNSTSYRYYIFRIADAYNTLYYMGLRRMELQEELPDSSSSSSSLSSASSISSPSSESSASSESSSSYSSSSYSSASSESSSSYSSASSNSSSSLSSESSNSSSSSSSGVPEGYTWGCQYPPFATTPEPWIGTWVYKGTTTQATTDGNWGRLLLTSTDSFVSNVKDSETYRQKRIIITLDNCDSGYGQYTLYYRASDTPFAKNDEITGPTWILYTTPVVLNYRYVQLRVDGV